jgi:hypothetical protein
MFKIIFFFIVIILIIYINYKLNNLLGIGYINCIKYFFIFLSLLFVIYPNFDKEYIKLKNIYFTNNN